MEFNSLSDAVFQPGEVLEAADIPTFLTQLEAIDDEVALAWKSNKDKGAYPGIWLRHGHYKLKHGSFVDPYDLSCYAAQYYVADEAGRHFCSQIGHGLEGPEDAVVLESVGQLRDALTNLLVEYVPEDEDSFDADAADETDDEVYLVDPLEERKLLQPDGTFELHGSLTKGWRAVLYTAPIDTPDEKDETEAARVAEGFASDADELAPEHAEAVLVFD